MKVYPIETGNFKLDGGAMFGVVPKTLWTRHKKADENNLVNWAMRCMLIEDGNRLTLVDTGIGDKQSDKFFSHYYLNGDASLDNSLKQLGFNRDDITDVLLTHLHFDHCGGSVIRNGEGKLETTFRNANYWSNKEHWKWATEPNPREAASFLKENILPIQEHGQLNFIDHPTGDLSTQNPLNLDLRFVNGHTESQMIPQVQYKGKTLAFMADLIPSSAHIPLPWVIGYDTRPLLSMGEKEKFLKEAADGEYLLFFEHDAEVDLATVEHTEKGVRLKETYSWNEVFGGEL